MAKARKSNPAIGSLECRVVRNEKTNQMLINHAYAVGQVAQFAMDLFRGELHTFEPIVNLAGGGASGNYQALQRTGIQQSVKRACDGAEALFDEMAKRGWIIQAPTLDEIIEPVKENGFGMHPSSHG